MVFSTFVTIHAYNIFVITSTFSRVSITNVIRRTFRKIAGASYGNNYQLPTHISTVFCASFFIIPVQLGKFLKPCLHLLHCRPSMLGLHSHCPSSLLQICPSDPSSLQSQTLEIF